MLTRSPSDWVTNAAVRYITTTFASLKDRRMRNYQAHVYSLPYYREYRQWRGRPPIHPELIQRLKAQLQSADQDLQTGVNQDWRACVLKYPEVLDYYYSQVEVALPGGAIDPPFGGHGAPTPGPGLGLSHAGSTKRKGARHSVPPETLGFEDLHIGGPPPAPRRRDSGSYILSGRNKAPTAPMPPAAPSYPPTFGFH